MVEIKPQPGKQEKFLSTPADIAVYGGAAGGGKTFSLLIEPVRHIENENFVGVIFRRETPQITNPGGIWDAAGKVYPFLGASPNQTNLFYLFETKSKVKFSHLEQEKDVLAWQGSEVPFIGWDELTHFTEKQFFYMLSRNRSTCGVKPYVRATTNPDPDSWVRTFLDWWIGEDGFPIPERDGVLRWFRRENDEMIWSDTKNHEDCKSVTFISAKLEDNKILMESDPGYQANLKALSYVDRMQLKEGNWNIKPSAGNFFKKEWFEIVDAAPVGCESVRYWDRASTEPNPTNPNPDWSVGFKLSRDKRGTFYIEDIRRDRKRPLGVEMMVKNTASQDGLKVTVGIEQDPGQAGVSEADSYTRLLAGYIVKLNRVTTDKVTRAKAFSAQCEAGNVKVVRGKWNDAFFKEYEQFPEPKAKDDQVDAGSGAFNLLVSNSTGDFTKEMAQSKVGTVASPLKGSKDLW